MMICGYERLFQMRLNTLTEWSEALYSGTLLTVYAIIVNQRRSETE